MIFSEDADLQRLLTTARSAAGVQLLSSYAGYDIEKKNFRLTTGEYSIEQIEVAIVDLASREKKLLASRRNGEKALFILTPPIARFNVDDPDTFVLIERVHVLTRRTTGEAVG